MEIPQTIFCDAFHRPHFDGKKFEYESNAEEARKEISTVVELPLWALTAVEEHVQRRIEKAIKFDREKLVQYIESQKYFLRI